MDMHASIKELQCTILDTEEEWCAIRQWGESVGLACIVVRFSHVVRVILAGLTA